MDKRMPKVYQDQFTENRPSNNNDCRYEKCLDRMPLAIAYVPWQVWNETYRPETALERGTIFPDLDLPWVGTENHRRMK